MTHAHTRPLSFGLAFLGLLCAFAVAACGDDDGDSCTDACTAIGDLRCGGPVIQECVATTDGCTGAWSEVQDCNDTGQICMDPGTGPVCGTLCTDQCAAGASQCLDTVVQQCEANQDGCLRWVDGIDCDDATQVCSVVSGDATCVAP